MPEINEATIRLLTRHGCEVVVAAGSGCCGSLRHHLGQETPALALARADIDAWERERAVRGIDAIVINASGCGTTVKDYGFMLRDDPAYAEKAARIGALARDVTEIVESLGLRPPIPRFAGINRRVAYHSACSMQHGQSLHSGPKALLAAAGFETLDVPEGHLCCGSAGTYNLLQPEIADKLRAAQARQYRPHSAGSGRHRKYRLHHPARRRLSGAGRAHRRVARLGHRRPEPAALRRAGSAPD